MKKSMFNLCWFVFLACLSIVLPVYVLMSGSATLLPLVKFGAYISAIGGIVGFSCTALLIFFAEKRQSLGAHQQLDSLYAHVCSMKNWVNAWMVSRIGLQSVLLLALGLPVLAGVSMAGLVGALLGQALIRSYASRVTPFKVKGNRTYVNAAFVKDNHFSGFGLGKKR